MFAQAPTTPWLDALNPEQRAAATHVGGPLLILAGAGTGKTTTLCARVAWLLSEGIPAERILLLTFTRRAAREMIERSRSLVERVVPNAGRLVAGTFHSIAHRMVRAHASALALPPGFGVLDAADAADLMDFVRQEQGYAASQRRFPRAQTMLDIYSRTVNAQRPLKEMLAQAWPWCEEHHDALGSIFRAYGARKRSLGLIDLDDLLLYWRALAVEEVIGQAMADSFEHILVDEYQDVNGLQVDVVRALRQGREGLTVVGDDFQAIYGFRAASASHILDFPGQFPGTQTVTLERNYRSSAPILAIANAVSEQDRLGFAKRLWTDREVGRSPELVFPRDESDQAVAVCERVLAAREEGMDLRAQAVLFRTGHDSALLELELTRRDIPFVKYGGLRYLEAAHVKDMIALLRLLDNTADEVSWFRVLQLLDGVGPTRARRILEALRAPGGGPPQLALWPEAGVHVPPDAREHADRLIGALAAAQTDGPPDPGAQVERLATAIAPLIIGHYPDGMVRVGDLEQLAASARGAHDVRHFVSELVLDPPASSAELAGPPHLDEDYLVLSTVHSAKGLEWDAVHLIAAYDGNFPADMNATAEGVWSRSGDCCTWRSHDPDAGCTSMSPLRYYHRPHGGDDAHGYSKASRFLTDAVQALFTITHTTDPQTADRGQSGPARRVAVSVDALFG